MSITRTLLTFVITGFADPLSVQGSLTSNCRADVAFTAAADGTTGEVTARPASGSAVVVVVCVFGSWFFTVVPHSSWLIMMIVWTWRACGRRRGRPANRSR